MKVYIPLTVHDSVVIYGDYSVLLLLPSADHRYPPPLDGEPNFHELYSKVVCQVATKWMEIGVQLLIPQNILNQIGHDFTLAAEKCHAVFAEWKSRQTRPYMWGIVIDVLQSELVGEAALAENLKEYLCTAPTYT